MAVEINANKAEDDIIGKIIEDVRRKNEFRADYVRQCIVNVMFLYGKHHFTLSRLKSDASIGQHIAWELETNRSKGALKRTSNYILPLFRSLYSRMIRMKANVHAEPMTSTEKDRDAARVSKEVAEDFWDNCNRNDPWMASEFTGMQAVWMRATLYMMTVGMGYLNPFFNPKAKSFVYDQARKDVIEADVGEAQVRVLMPLDVFRDRFNRHIIIKRFMSPEQVEYEFDREVEPSKIDEEAAEIKIQRMLEGTDIEKEEKDGVYVYTKYCVPTSKYPQGQMISMTEKELLTEPESPLPPECKNRIPIYEFRYQDLGFSSNGQGCVEQVVDLQQDYNFTISRIAQHKKVMTGKILTPRGGKLSVKHDDIVGQIIQYSPGMKPEMQAAPSVPEYYFKEIMRIREDMENMMNSHDASMGQTPGQVKSGVGIQNLSNRDEAQIAPELIMCEQKLGFFAEHVLDIIQHNYNERRLLSISGEDLAFEIKSFIGSDLFGQKRIQIRMGSNFPLDKTERTNYILMLKKEGFISPERAKELLEFTDIDGAFKSLDETAAKQDILNIIDGNMEVIAEPYEDHTIFLKVIQDFMKGSVYTKLPPEVRKRILMWQKDHQKYLLAEQQAAAMMGALLPPAAQPQVGKQQGA